MFGAWCLLCVVCCYLLFFLFEMCCSLSVVRFVVVVCWSVRSVLVGCCCVVGCMLIVDC